MEGEPGRIRALYKKLFAKYGHQGWWPVSPVGYHSQDYDYPKTEEQKFEICLGALLAQGVKWDGAKKAVENLQKAGIGSPQSLLSADETLLKEAIRPAGYFNQKARKLREFCRFYQGLDGKIPAREGLLGVWGIGPETADSILLYGYRVPTFVVDAYTKRLLCRIGMAKETSTYEGMKELFEKSLEKDYRVYQEFHALMVEDGKRDSKARRPDQ